MFTVSSSGVGTKLSAHSANRQTVFYTPTTLTVSAGDEITGRLSCAPNARNNRDLDITVVYEAPGDEEVEIQYKMCVALSALTLSHSHLAVLLRGWPTWTYADRLSGRNLIWDLFAAAALVLLPEPAPALGRSICLVYCARPVARVSCVGVRARAIIDVLACRGRALGSGLAGTERGGDGRGARRGWHRHHHRSGGEGDQGARAVDYKVVGEAPR